MFLTWSGRGLLATIGFMTTLASCAGLIDVSIVAFCFAFSLGLIGSGLICRHFGRVWRRPDSVDTLYGIGLENWGKIYLWIGATLSFLFALLFGGKLIYLLANGLPLPPLLQ
jgi:hypothetical protein